MIIRLIKSIIEAVRNQDRDHKAPRYQRRMSARYSGRMTSEGKYFGGVPPKKEKRLERFLAGKGEL